MTVRALFAAALALLLTPQAAAAQIDDERAGDAACPDCGDVSFVPAPGGDVRPLVDGQTGGGILVCAMDPRGCDGASSGPVGVVEVAPAGAASGGGGGDSSGGGGAPSGGGPGNSTGVPGGSPPPPTCTPVASAPTPANIGNAPLPAGDLGHDPYVTGLTGLDTGVWYQGSTQPVGWVQPGTLGVRSDCSTYRSIYGGYTAAPTEYRWHFDEDDIVRTSAHPGTPQQWAARHTYDIKGDYTLAVEVRWSVVTSPGGGGGTRGAWAYADHPVIEIRSALLPG